MIKTKKLSRKDPWIIGWRRAAFYSDYSNGVEKCIIKNDVLRINSFIAADIMTYDK